MRTSLHHISIRFSQGKMSAHEIGAYVAFLNVFLFFASTMIIFLRPYFLLWWMGVVLPIFFLGMWAWIAHVIVQTYHPLNLHQSLVLTKVGISPFALFFLISIILLLAQYPFGIAALSLWNIFLLYVVLSSLGLLLAGATFFIIFLHHRHSAHRG